jgi:hypothetical protein
MKSLKEELPLVAEMPEATLRQVDWGGMTVEVAEIHETMDVAPFFKGLPDDRCQSAHWGYVLKGQMRYRYADREEVYSAGEVYYAEPGHLPILEAGCQYVEFSSTDDLRKTMEVVERNMQAAG